jgi:beta-glucanase (GH16 family)
MIILAALLLALPASASSQEQGWQLAWSDEFDGKAGALPDPKRWTYDTGDDGFGNNELEDYCAPGGPPPCDPKKPNAYQDGSGRLVLEARKEPSGKWTSARLKTFGLRRFHYGRIEARLRLPYGPGLWPAFWMLGVDISTAGWPGSGEIDIMENVPGDVPGGLGVDTIKATLHGPGYSGVGGYGQVVKLPKGGHVDDGFHIYGAIWSPGKISFYIDDWTKPYFTATKKGLPKGAPWVFDKPFFAIMNLAVGGSWPRDPNASTPDPARVLVDWVRFYRRAPIK